MKLKTSLLLFLLIGIAVVEWGCNDDDTVGSNKYDVIGIRQTSINSTSTHNRLTSDTATWDSFYIKMSYQTIELAHNKLNSNSSILKALSLDSPEYIWRIDSIFIYDILHHPSDDIKDRIHIVSVKNGKIKSSPTNSGTLNWQIEDYWHVQHSFKLADQPLEETWHRYKFEIFGSDSTHFTAVSDSIYILK